MSPANRSTTLKPRAVHSAWPAAGNLMKLAVRRPSKSPRYDHFNASCSHAAVWSRLAAWITRLTLAPRGHMIDRPGARFWRADRYYTKPWDPDWWFGGANEVDFRKGSCMNLCFSLKLLTTHSRCRRSLPKNVVLKPTGMLKGEDPRHFARHCYTGRILHIPAHVYRSWLDASQYIRRPQTVAFSSTDSSKSRIGPRWLAYQKAVSLPASSEK